MRIALRIPTSLIDLPILSAELFTQTPSQSLILAVANCFLGLCKELGLWGHEIVREVNRPPVSQIQLSISTCPVNPAPNPEESLRKQQAEGRR